MALLLFPSFPSSSRRPQASRFRVPTRCHAPHNGEICRGEREDPRRWMYGVSATWNVLWWEGHQPSGSAGLLPVKQLKHPALPLVAALSPSSSTKDSVDDGVLIPCQPKLAILRRVRLVDAGHGRFSRNMKLPSEKEGRFGQMNTR
jgi:hypothetical protein